MLKDLHIRNFRGIRSLDLTDFGRVNLFIGENGGGKTSVLESIFLIASPTSPALVSTISEWRDMHRASAISDDALRSIFNREKPGYAAEFSWENEDGQKHLHILPIAPETAQQSFEVSDNEPVGPAGPAPIFQDFMYGIQYQYFDNEKDKENFYDFRLETNPNGFAVHPVHQPKPFVAPGGFYIHARRATSANETNGVIARLHQLKRIKEFYDAIGSIIPGIQKAVPAPRQNNTQITLVDIGLPEMVPANVLGDGFNRLALIITGLLAAGRYLIVDEIDSGFHHSTMSRLWKELASLTRTMKKQAFCATHDEEMLLSTLEAFKDDPAALRIFRIDRLKDGNMKATKFTYETFKRSDNLGLDIR